MPSSTSGRVVSSQIYTPSLARHASSVATCAVSIPPFGRLPYRVRLVMPEHRPGASIRNPAAAAKWSIRDEPISSDHNRNCDALLRRLFHDPSLLDHRPTAGARPSRCRRDLALSFNQRLTQSPDSERRKARARWQAPLRHPPRRRGESFPHSCAGHSRLGETDSRASVGVSNGARFGAGSACRT